MNKKLIAYGISFLALSSVLLIGSVATSVQASNINIVTEDSSVMPAPPEALKSDRTPIKIITKDGSFARVSQSINSYNYSEDEIVYSESNTTDTTEVIVVDGNIYIKEEVSE